MKGQLYMALNSVIKTAFEEVLTMPSDYDDTQPVKVENFSPSGYPHTGLNGVGGGVGLYQRFDSVQLGNPADWSLVFTPATLGIGGTGAVGLVNNATNAEYKAGGGQNGDDGGASGYNYGTVTPDTEHPIASAPCVKITYTTV